MNRRAIWSAVFCVALIAAGLALRVPLLSQPYHQDEYKWAFIVNPEYGLAGTLPHPPLSEILYHEAGELLGYEHLRVVPFVLSGIFSFLLLYFMRRLFDVRTAFIALALWSIDLYAVLASVQIDIDGVLLPLWVLLTLGGYAIWKREGASRTALICIVVGVVGGFFSKLSFILAPAAIVADLLWAHRERVLSYVTVRTVVPALGALTVLGVVGFMLRDTLIFSYAGKFIFSGDRSWFQLLFLSAKAILLLSPLLVLSAALGLKYFRELTVWFWYAIAALVFYAVVFDFTHTTMDRYWMVLILPFTVIAAVALARLLPREMPGPRVLASGVGLSLLTIAGALLAYSGDKMVVPLQPKTAFIDAFVSGQWSILIPFTGGSGPLGFYLPLDGLALLWIAALVGAAVLLFARAAHLRLAALSLFLTAGIVYNTLGVLEYATGTYFGSAPAIYRALIQRVNEDAGISQVITYNDIGAYELTLSGKYFKRLYTDPMFAESNVGKLTTYDGHFMVLDVPEINKDSVYWRYFTTCKEDFRTNSEDMAGYIFDCRGATFED